MRLTGTKENDDEEYVKKNGNEDCEKLVRKILDEMGVLHHGLNFHEVHCIPRVASNQTEPYTPRPPKSEVH